MTNVSDKISIHLNSSASTVLRDDKNDLSNNFASTDDETYFEEISPKQGKNFSYSFGLVVSCLGCVLGTGNIWRFPRIVALISSEKGSLTFILVWISFLFLWSIPLIVCEYTMGRYCRGSPLTAFYKFLGLKFIWLGAWVTAISFFISSYFSVVGGWCFYYFYLSCSLPELPTTEPVSTEYFNNFTQTLWPLLTHALCLVICGITVFWGVKGIELANTCLVPIQLIIVLITFFWSLSRQYAAVGIQFMFTPDWSTMANPQLYIEAICQNAFDTAAGMGLFTAYAAYFSRKTGAVRYGVLLPCFNNLVSLTCGIMIFATVFSTLITTSPTLTIPQIVNIMKTTGPGSTGLTFTWIPVLMSSLGVTGRVLCGLFFLCLSFAAVSSMIAYVELTAQTIHDFGVGRKCSTIVSLTITFLVGVPSAVKIEILKNQDFVWSFGLIISGLGYWFLVIRYGPFKFRKCIVNEMGISDWHLPRVWVIIIAGIVPIEGLIILIWWMYTNIAHEPEWYMIKYESLMVTILEWAILFILLGGLNLVVYLLKLPLFDKAGEVGYDPYHPEDVPLKSDCTRIIEIPINTMEKIMEDVTITRF